MAVEPCKVLVVAGTSSGVGKTTLSVGLMAMLRCRSSRCTKLAFARRPDWLSAELQHSSLTVVRQITRPDRVTRVCVGAGGRG